MNGLGAGEAPDGAPRSALPLSWMAESDDVLPADALAERVGPAQVVAAALGLGGPDEVVKVRDALREVVSRARSREDVEDEARARALLATVAGDVDDAASTGDGPADTSAKAIAAVRAYVHAGDVDEAVTTLGAALGVARSQRVDGLEAAILPFAALASMAAGACEQADAMVRRNAVVRARLDPAEARASRAMAIVAEVAMRAAWGEVADGHTALTEGLREVEPESIDACVICAFGADALGAQVLASAGGSDPLLVAVERLRAEGVDWAAEAATRAMARQLLEQNHPDAALELLAATPPPERRGRGPSSLDRAHRLLIEARAAADTDDRAVALARAQDAVQHFEELGATRWQIDALLTVSALDDGEVGARALVVAAERSLRAEPGAHALARQYEVLWSRRPPMRVEVIGARRIMANGQPVALGDKPEQLFLSVLLAGPGGVHWETVASWLWPDDDDMAKLKSRVSSTTNLARKALGSEAWRLERVGPLLRVLRFGLTCDLDDEAEERARTGTSARAAESLLPGWEDLEWVEDLAFERAERNAAGSRGAGAREP